MPKFKNSERKYRARQRKHDRRKRDILKYAEELAERQAGFREEDPGSRSTTYGAKRHKHLSRKQFRRRLRLNPRDFTVN